MTHVSNPGHSLFLHSPRGMDTFYIFKGWFKKTEQNSAVVRFYREIVSNKKACVTEIPP